MIGLKPRQAGLRVNYMRVERMNQEAKLQVQHTVYLTENAATAVLFLIYT